MINLGKELFHLQCLPYGLRCALLRSIHHHNWYLVGTQSLISTRKYWQLIKQNKQALMNKINQKDNHHGKSYVYLTGDKVLLKNAWKFD